MSQREILDILIKKERWMTSLEIAKYLNIGIAAVNTCLRRLEKGKFVEKMKNDKAKNGNLYKIDTDAIERLYDHK